MSEMRKSLMTLAAGMVLLYVFTPLVAGLIGSYDRRGPKIFWVEHHDLFYNFGYAFTHDGKPRVPEKERTWFYGMEGAPINLEKKMQDLQEAVKVSETNHTQNLR